jgi:hypothetical protein
LVKWKLILVHLEIVLILSKIGARFAPNVPLALKRLWEPQMVLLGGIDHVEDHFSLFEDCVNLDAR